MPGLERFGVTSILTLMALSHETATSRLWDDIPVSPTARDDRKRYGMEPAPIELAAPCPSRVRDMAKRSNLRALSTRNWGERYLNEILAAISHFQVPDLKSPPQLQTNKLVIACHSGGGNGMRNLVGSLGQYQSNLRACWGFDCLYDGSGPPDHATFWYRWLSGPNARPLDIIYGPDTLPQSVKLDLMGRGLATPEGNKAEPPRPALKNLNVSIGHYDAFPAFGQMVKVNDLDPSFVDRFMIPPTADGLLCTSPGRRGNLSNKRSRTFARRFPSRRIFTI
jgi:hypothetical protein